MKKLALLLSAILMSAVAYSQDVPKVEIPLGFSFVNVHPNLNPITSFNVFGGGGQFDVNFGNYLGIKADFMGYTQSTGLRDQLIAHGYAGTANGNMFTYMFGPQIKKHTGMVQPFVEFLFGAAHTNAYATIYTAQTGLVSGSSNNNAFAMALGGGIDLRVAKHFAIRPVEVDYLYTRFGVNGTRYTGNQNNFRYVGGVNLLFGGAPPVPPTAVCSASPASVRAGEPITVTATGANFNPKHTLEYAWTAVGGKLSIANTQTATIITTNLPAGTYTANATITDPKGPKNRNVANCGANFNVNVPHNPPQVTCSASPTTVKSGETSAITANATSPDNAEISSYAYTATAGTISGSGTSATLGTTNQPGETINVTVRATDSRGLVGTCSTAVAVIGPTISCISVEDWGECTFEKNPKKPWRVDNDCKDTLDKLALRLQQMPNGKLEVVGYTDEKEVVSEQTQGAQRAVNVKYYLTTDGPTQSDASRIEPRQGGAKGQATHFYFVGEGALCSGQVVEGTPVDESVVKGQSRAAPAPATKHKKAAAPPANQ